LNPSDVSKVEMVRKSLAHVSLFGNKSNVEIPPLCPEGTTVETQRVYGNSQKIPVDVVIAGVYTT